MLSFLEQTHCLNAHVKDDPDIEGVVDNGQGQGQHEDELGIHPNLLPGTPTERVQRELNGHKSGREHYLVLLISLPLYSQKQGEEGNQGVEEEGKDFHGDLLQVTEEFALVVVIHMAQVVVVDGKGEGRHSHEDGTDSHPEERLDGSPFLELSRG